MKKMILKAAAAFIVLTVFVAATTLTADRAVVSAETAPGKGKITVTGQGSVKVNPDIAYITLGVQTRNADSKAAQAENNEIMTKIINSLKAMNIDNKDIKTANYYMYPEYDYNEKGGQRVVAYSVTNSVTVTVRKIDSVGAVIDTGIAAGANNAQNIQFSISDSSTYYAQALSLAITNAKAKSTAIAGALGVTVSNPVEVTENSSYYMPVMSESANVRAEKDMAAGASMPVQSTELEISASISCVFEY